jgi:hypothetical protein
VIKGFRQLFLGEPKGHVTRAVFEQGVMQAQATGLTQMKNLSIAISRAALFVAPSEN